MSHTRARTWGGVQVQALVGGRVKMMATGSAPLSPDIQCFIQTCFNCPVRQGYGCTETGGGSAIGHLLDNTVSQVGPPTPCTYLRLRDWDEGNYRNSDLDNKAIGRSLPPSLPPARHRPWGVL